MFIEALFLTLITFIVGFLICKIYPSFYPSIKPDATTDDISKLKTSFDSTANMMLAYIVITIFIMVIYILIKLIIKYVSTKKYKNELESLNTENIMIISELQSQNNEGKIDLKQFNEIKEIVYAYHEDIVNNKLHLFNAEDKEYHYKKLFEECNGFHKSLINMKNICI